MLSRILLVLLQLIVAASAARLAMRQLPGLGVVGLFAYAVIVAVVVWIVGLVGSQLLRATAMPSSATLVACLTLALVGAGVITWLPALLPELARPLDRIPVEAYPWLGALLGYHAKR
jgi:hypothetical protein